MIETIEFKGETYLELQSKGNAQKFARPFAEEIIKPGFDKVGYDIGCKYAEWSLPNSLLVDPEIDSEHDAMKLPRMNVDYVFSSHCLEHLANWVDALEHWHKALKRNGILFLYLPSMEDQNYWRPWHNRKHIHYLNPDIMQKYFEDNENMWQKVFVSGTDLNCSFYCVAEKI